MNTRSINYLIITALFIFAGFHRPVFALQMQHFIQSEAHADILGDATGLKMHDDGVVYVTSAEDGSLLKVVADKVEVFNLTPAVFSDTDLGSIDLLGDGRLVVTNEGSGKVAILDQQHNLQVFFSQSGGDPGELSSPESVAVSVNNRIYVGDAGNEQITVFNDQGAFLHSFGRHGNRKKDIFEPTHISLDADENIYILEGHSRISIFDRHGNLIDRITAESLRDQFQDTPKFSALAADLNGTLYFGDSANDQVAILDWRNHKVLSRFGGRGQSRGQYLQIDYLSVNNRGQIAILDKRSEKVEVFQLDEQSFDQPKLTDSLQVAYRRDSNCRSVHRFINEQVLCVQPEDQGIVILAEDGREVGGFAREVTEPIALHSASERVAILSENQLHVYDQQGKHRFTTGRYGIGPSGFRNPAFVFVHHKRYYVSDVGNNRVQIFSDDGQFLEQITAGVDEHRLFTKIGPIAVDKKGRVHIADNGEGLVRVIDESRNLVASIGLQESSIHQAKQFYALDFDQQDRLYVLAGSDFNDYGVTIYRDSQPYQRFGAGGENGSDYYFDEAGSMSVSSSATNSIYVNDSKLKRHYRFDLLEYPDAAFALQVDGNHQQLQLSWSSSPSPLIFAYDIESAANENGPFKVIKTTRKLSETIDTSEIGDNLWFRIVSRSGFGLPAAPSAPKENQFLKIVKLFQNGDYETVVGVADKTLRVSPDNDDVRDLLGMSLYALKDYTRVIHVYEQLRESEQYRKKAMRYQIQAYNQLEQFLDARALIDQVLETAPEEIEPYLTCAQLNLKLNDVIGAISCAEDGLVLDPSHALLQYLLGHSYIEVGLVDEGLTAYQVAAKNSPDDDSMLLKIAASLYALEKYTQALELYDSVSQKKPVSGDAAIGKARSLLQLGRDAEAKSVALKLIGKKETKGDGFYLLGKIAAKRGKYQETILRLTRATQDKPQLIDVWISLANAYIQLGQPNKAVELLDQGIEQNPDSYALYEFAGKVELEAKKYSSGNAYLSKAVALRPQSLDAQKWYARGLFLSRSYHLAAIHAQISALIAPLDLDVLILQANIASQQGKIGTAIEFLKEAISIDPTSAELQYQIGRIYQDANLFDASRKHLEKAANINPVWASPYVALGNLYKKRRLFDQAIIAYEKALELEPSSANQAFLNVAFGERKQSLEFQNNTPQLLLSDLHLKKVFSATYKKYQNQPIGSVVLKNVSATDYGNLKLSFQIKEFMDFPTILEIDRISGSETQTLDIKATFNNKILEVDEDTGVQVEVKLTFLRDGQKDDITLTQPMTIYGKNAIIWREPQMIGSFVTPKDDTLRDYVRQVISAYQPEHGPLNANLVSAMAYFSSLTASGIDYAIDPNTPFTELREDQIDYVQFPRETLYLKSGDCDDLSVLISAGLENLGIHTAFIEIPGHLFLMFDTGILAEDARLISQDESLLVIKDGNVWIPLEATMVSTSFIEAWAEGARKYHQAVAENNLGIIDLNQAWMQYQPVTLRKADYTATLPEKIRARSLISQTQKQLLEKSIQRLVRPYQAMVANDSKNVTARLQIAILYARFGLYEDAELAFEALNELAPENSAVQLNQGNLYFLQSDYARALQSYTRALSLDSHDGGVWLNISMAHYKSGDLKQAESSFKKALQLYPELQETHLSYAKLLTH